MLTLTADGALQELLAEVKEPAEVRDLKGKVLGHFTPAVHDAALYEKAARIFDLEEANRVAATEHDGYTLDQVMEHLRALDQPKG